MQPKHEDVKPPFVLSRPQVSRAHKFFEVMQQSAAEHVSNASNPDVWFGLLNRCKLPDLTVVLIEHDWTAAVDLNPDDYKTYDSSIEIRLPSANCLFEFIVNGVHAIWWRSYDMVMYATKVGDGYLTYLSSIISDPTSEHFSINFCDPQPMNDPEDGIDATNDSRNALAHYLDHQVASACVVLEAELAYRDVVRAPHKLNAARAKKGKLPLYSYHIIKLANRKRAAALPDAQSQESGRRLRMHFVRGHWRHFEQHKTWVKWHVRGDPDLGRIEKEYRL